MREIKRTYWNPAKTAKGMLLCSGCPFQSPARCSLGYQVRDTKIADRWVPASIDCKLQNVTWTVLEDREPDVSEKTG